MYFLCLSKVLHDVCYQGSIESILFIITIITKKGKVMYIRTLKLHLSGSHLMTLGK